LTKLRIIIEGGTGAGKSGLQQHIEETLRRDGFNIHSRSDDLLEYSNEVKQAQRTKWLRESHKEIEIVSQQLPRSGKSVLGDIL